MVENIGHDSLHVALTQIPHHRVSFTTARLSVSKYGAVIPFEGIFDERESGAGVYLLLFRGFIEDLVKTKRLVVSVFGVWVRLLL